jgi:tRNA A-37 threonylcarbamoyl transferase component Bud32/tetratricopeptide (TPR) repeat protein
MACLDETTLTAYVEGELDEAARAQALAHVDSCASCRRLVAALAVAHSGPPPPVEDRALPAAQVGRYRLLGILGAGAMGRVYAAYDPELDRKVAIKLLHRKTKDPEELRARLMREAQAMARLAHPHVLSVFHVGTFAGQVFVVMELVDGLTLDRWVAAKPRGWRAIVDVFRRAGEGLAAAHEAGIIHRDFKPENVLVSKDGRVLVTDFGLARLSRDDDDEAGEGDGAAVTLTQSGALVGTPAYMAPEQLAGAAARARADVFSFCVALHEALFGERPFAGATVAELARAIHDGAIRDARSRAVPAWLRRAIARGLAADPDARPALPVLLALLGGDRERGRARAATVAIALVAGVTVGILGWRASTRRSLCRGARDHLAGVWDGARRDELARAFARSGAPFAEQLAAKLVARLDAYADAWVAMRTEACEATSVRHVQSAATLDERMRCLDDHLRTLSAVVGVYRSVDRTAAARAAEVSLPPLDECSDARALAGSVLPSDPALRTAVTELRARLAETDALARAGKRQDALPAVRANALEAQRIGTASEIAWAQLQLGRALIRVDEDGSRAALQECARSSQRAGDDGRAAICWDDLAQIAALNERTDDARQMLELAEAALERRGSDDLTQQRLVALHHLSDGEVDGHFRDYKQQRRKLEQGVSILARYFPDSLELAKARGNLCSALQATDLLAAARECHRELLVEFERIVGVNHPDTAIAVNNLGVDERLFAHPTEALALADRALAIDRAWLLPGDVGLGYDLVARAGALLDLGGRDSEALADAQRALAIAEAHLAKDSPELGQFVLMLGTAQLAVGDRGAARANLERSNSIVSIDDGGLLAETWFLLARALGSGERARSLAEQARDKMIALEKLGHEPRRAAMLDAVQAWLARR